VDAKLISFGLIKIDGRRFDGDVVLDAGNVRRRNKKPRRPTVIDTVTRPGMLADVGP
jgi:hypothetical protein